MSSDLIESENLPAAGVSLRKRSDWLPVRASSAGRESIREGGSGAAVAFRRSPEASRFANPALGSNNYVCGKLRAHRMGYLRRQPNVHLSEYGALQHSRNDLRWRRQDDFRAPRSARKSTDRYRPGGGLTNRLLGEMSGEESHTLAVGELPSHNHTAVVDNSGGTSDTPVNNVPAVNSEGIQHYGTAMNGAMNAGAIGNTGGSQAHNNMQPTSG